MEDAVKYTKLVLQRYADFQGRSRRAEYWWFSLAMLCWSILERITTEVLRSVTVLGLLAALVVFVVSIALIVPSLAVSFRRLHDIDKSAWWLLIILIPLLGLILLLVWFATPGTAGPNRFGPDPIATEAEPEAAPLVS